jgi:hypothetical protein
MEKKINFFILYYLIDNKNEFEFEFKFKFNFIF